MVDFKGLANKAKNLISSNDNVSSKFDEAVDKAGKIIDDKTGDKFKSQIDSAKNVTKNYVHGDKEKSGDAPQAQQNPENPAQPGQGNQPNPPQQQ